MSDPVRFRLLAIGIAGLVCCAVAGCSGSQTQAAQSPAPGTPAATNPAASAPAPAAKAPAAPSAVKADSMTVITQPEAAGALAQSVRAPVRGKATVEGGVAAVFYGPSVAAGTNPDVPVPNSVRVVLVTGPKAASWFDDYRGKVRAVALPGLGDKAYYDGYASVSVLKGDAYVRIAVIGPHGISLAGEKTLAADALPRM